MKYLIFAMLATFSFVVQATSLVGQYSGEKEISLSLVSEAECAEENGTWNLSEEACLVQLEDTAEIKKSGQNFSFEIYTVGDNYHACDFKSSARFMGKNKIISSIQTEEYDVKKKKNTKVDCVITATITENGRMSIIPNDHCSSLCGANASFESAQLMKANELKGL